MTRTKSSHLTPIQLAIENQIANRRAAQDEINHKYKHLIGEVRPTDEYLETRRADRDLTQMHSHADLVDMIVRLSNASGLDVITEHFEYTPAMEIVDQIAMLAMRNITKVKTAQPYLDALAAKEQHKVALAKLVEAVK